MVTRAVPRDEEGKKRVEKTELKTDNIDTIKRDRKTAAEVRTRRKYTWEGPDDMAENELEAAPPAIDEKDPNYVDEEEEKKIVKEEESDELVVGEVE
ncbi:hypothetical protein GH714_029727 [Hevea brasiliensis]|uniref:Uncharacterized protein n=1 Tax=Hevea brasiliensis TaxID=3981 RepID=A0A6A6M6I4_HEVBR|nr:hypothetical protein GH714_029727 [Hevea brasiliensis]